jgi:hypothetical protein
MWHKSVLRKLRQSGLFREVILAGAKVRALLSETVFLDIYYDPTSGSYSYALIDSLSPYAGDKRVLGWDDYPHESAEQIRQLGSFPHHFQYRDEAGVWIFAESPMRGRVEREMDVVIAAVREYMQTAQKRG